VSHPAPNILKAQLWVSRGTKTVLNKPDTPTNKH
jgi:hypothetical protein